MRPMRSLPLLMVKAARGWAAFRNVRGDVWMPEIIRVVRKILNDQVREAAGRIRDGMTIASTEEMIIRYGRELAETEQPYLVNLAVEGYELAEVEAGKKSFDSDMFNKRAPTINLRADDFTLQAVHTPVVRWLEEVSTGSTRVNARRINNIQRKATQYWDEKKKRGFTPKEIAAQIYSRGLASTLAHATMIAQTNTAWSANEGAHRSYINAGVTVEEWFTVEDDKRCPWCKGMDGKKVKTGDPFWGKGDEYQVIQGDKTSTLKMKYDVQHPPLHPHCLTGETPITAVDKIAAFVATYDGPVVECILSDGRRFTVTANHMLLTPHGFIRADCIREGDDILDSTDAKGVVLGDPDDDNRPSPIEEVVHAFAESPGMTTVTVPTSSEYLHGDGKFINGTIDVIAPDSLLRGAAESLPGELLLQPKFSWPDVELATLTPKRNLADLLIGLRDATDGGVGTRCQSAAFSGRESLHAHDVGLAGGSDGDPILEKPTADGSPAYTESLADCQLAFPGQVSLAKVLFVNHGNLQTKVYDIATSSTLYLCNGVVSSNCRCILLPYFAGTDLINQGAETEVRPPSGNDQPVRVDGGTDLDVGAEPIPAQPRRVA